jgi:chemotaxis signal transduction protein
MSVPHLIFTCAGSPFALPIDQVLEVVQMVAIAARLPRAPRYCLGAIDYHGYLVPVIDLGARLGLCAPHREDDLVEARVILVEARPQEGAEAPRQGAPRELIGYVVDDVSELSDRPLAPLATSGQRFGGLVTGSVRWQENRSALVLDLTTGVLLPNVAGELLRRTLAEVQEQMSAAQNSAAAEKGASHS